MNDFIYTTEVALFLNRVYKYIEKRRPYETWTLAILNEKYYDVLDAEAGPRRALEVN